VLTQVLLNTPDNLAYEIPLTADWLNVVRATSNEIFLLMKDLIGENSRCLVHLDEHQKMCIRVEINMESGAAFSRGAMEAVLVLLCWRLM